MDPLDRAIGILDALGTWVGVALAYIALRLAKLARPAVPKPGPDWSNFLTLCSACHRLFDGSLSRLVRRNLALTASYAGYSEGGCVVCNRAYTLEAAHIIPHAWRAPA